MASIKQEMFRGIIWTSIEKYSGLVVSLVISAILARILSPEEYGVVAIATVMIAFFSMFATMGIGPAVIQRSDLSDTDINHIFTFSFFVGLTLALLFFVASWPIAAFNHNDQLIPICQLLSINVLGASINMVPAALMAKAKRFKAIAKGTLLLQISTGIVSVFAAMNGWGVYALLISPICTSIGIFFYNTHFFPVKLQLKGFTFEPIKRIFSFSVYQFLFEFSNYFSRNLDKIIIGRYLSIADLGYYEKSYRLMQLPLHQVTSVINPVLQPVLRTLQDQPQEIANKYNKIIRFVATLSFPIAVTMTFCAYEIIHIFYGGNWDAAVPTFAILALSGSLQMIQSTSGAIFLASNNAKAQFWVGIRNTITTVAGFMIAAWLYKTIEAMAWAWNITLLINFVCTFYILFNRVLHASILKMCQQILVPLVNAIAIAIALYFEGLALQDFNIFVSLAIKAFTSLIISLVIIQCLGQYNLKEMVQKRLKRTK